MVDLLEVLHRAKTGKPVAKNDWDLDYVVLPVRDLVKKFQLRWDRNQIVPCDTHLIDRLFQAGKELAIQSGVFCVDTGRIIQFSIEEIETAAARMPQALLMGEGKDARTLYARGVLDSRNPMVWAGNPGAPTPQELFIPCVQSWMKEPIVDLSTCGSITHLEGMAVENGSPMEIYAARWELRALRDALRQVGRPGMGLLAGQSAVSALGDAAISNPQFLRPTDAHIVSMFNELIIDYGNISRAMNPEGCGMRNASLATAMVGGYGGSAPGTAVVQIASFLLANLVCRADYHLLHPIHIRRVATSTREVMWVQSAVAQAFARQAPCVIVGDIYPKSGAGTREILLEVAANALAITVSGAHLEGVGSADGLLPNGTGLEARWMGEVGHAAVRQGIDLEEANQMILKLLDRYEYIFEEKNGNPGLRFDQVYNLETIEPFDEWMKVYLEGKDLLSKIGLSVLESG